MEPESSFAVLAESPYYFLSEEPDGYALWAVNGDETDDPVLTFPTGDAGRELAFVAFRTETRLGRWSRFFLIVALVAGPAWIVAEATQRILAMSREAFVTPDVFSEQIPTIWWLRAWVLDGELDRERGVRDRRRTLARDLAASQISQGRMTSGGCT